MPTTPFDYTMSAVSASNDMCALFLYLGRANSAFNGQGKPFIVLCGKSSWWKTDWLREWVAKEQHTRDATLGMLLCIVGLEDEEGDISAEIEEVMKDDGKLPVTYLGLWSHLASTVGEPPVLLTATCSPHIVGPRVVSPGNYCQRASCSAQATCLSHPIGPGAYSNIVERVPQQEGGLIRAWPLLAAGAGSTVGEACVEESCA